MIEILAWFVLVFSFFLACVGTVLPGIPGLGLVVVGMIIHKQILPDVFSWWTILAIAFLARISWLIDLFSGVYGAKLGGASRQGLIGATVGGAVGVLFGLAGLIVGPFLGAIIGDIYAKRTDLRELLKSGGGAALGFVISLVGRFALIGLSALVITIAIFVK